MSLRAKLWKKSLGSFKNSTLEDSTLEDSVVDPKELIAKEPSFHDADLENNALENTIPEGTALENPAFTSFPYEFLETVEEELSLEEELRQEKAVQAVKDLGLHSPFATYEVSSLKFPLLAVRPILPGNWTFAANSSTYVVAPDQKVFIAPAYPGTHLDAAESILTKRYLLSKEVDEDEHSSLQTKIDFEARLRLI